MLDFEGTGKCVILLTGQECTEVRMMRAHIPEWRLGFPFEDNVGLGKGKYLTVCKSGGCQDGSQVVLWVLAEGVG